MSDDKNQPVIKAELKEGADGRLETHNYTGGSFDERHGHVVVDDNGEVRRARDIDDKKMQRY